MTQPSAGQRLHDVVLLGDADAATELLAAGVHDFVILGPDGVSSVLDDDTDTWRLTTADGQTCRSRAVVAYQSPFVPLIPDLLGRRNFRGTAMHAALPAADFAPAGKRVAVLGGDSCAGELIERMARSGAKVEVFPLAPRRAVPGRRRSRGLARRRHVEVIASPVQEVTAVGVRTLDGIHHDADAIVYGTGFAVRAGLPDDTLVGSGGARIQQAWVDGAEPYLGVAVYGFPNYFTVAGTDFAAAMRYIVECLQLMGRHRRIEVRRSAQCLFNERVHLHQPSRHVDVSAFDVSSSAGVHDDIYQGPAVLTAADSSQQMRVTLTGRLEPFDGQYHWQGTVFGQVAEPLKRARTVTVTIGQRCAEGRITEQTSQGAHSITGVGEPPFPLTALQLA